MYKKILTAANNRAHTGTDLTIAFHGTGSRTLFVSALVTVSFKYFNSSSEI